MYSQDEKNKMAMKNATIDKFAAKKDPCPEGMVDDGRGGCLPKPITVNNKSNYVKGRFGQAAKGGPKEYAKSVINSMGLTDEEKKRTLEKINK
jgi:hypothetical protein